MPPLAAGVAKSRGTQSSPIEGNRAPMMCFCHVQWSTFVCADPSRSSMALCRSTPTGLARHTVNSLIGLNSTNTARISKPSCVDTAARPALTSWLTEEKPG
eukprot:CAMPEP_0181501042 /NCGR_PEP_ID=MMETSP1110-20121109/55570_1 /TAXON_ID=174948 /ORGANISM="Symbiodinium sp., Strain CCMP421" /LENGTH=100 /DNA_ID=CAMNT_0023629447 /DNA_START=54 /DNA_END=356 /DNA_ORIENTATION=+